MGTTFLHYLGHGCVLGFEAFVGSQAGRLGSDPGAVYLCVISERSHHYSLLNLSLSYNSAKFNAVTGPVPKE